MKVCFEQCLRGVEDDIVPANKNGNSWLSSKSSILSKIFMFSFIKIRVLKVKKMTNDGYGKCKMADVANKAWNTIGRQTKAHR